MDGRAGRLANPTTVVAEQSSGHRSGERFAELTLKSEPAGQVARYRPGMGLLRDVRPMAVDAAVAVALTVLSQIEIWAPELMPSVGETSGSRPFLTVTTLLMTLPLAVRRLVPLAVLVVVLGAGVAQELLSEPNEGLSTLAALLIACYSASAYTQRGRTVLGAGIVVVASGLMGEDLSDHLFIAIVLGAAWLMGFVVGQRSDQVALLSDHNRDLHERLTEAADALAAAERSALDGAADSPGLANLTAREVDVARAIAQGMSNAEIAAHLVISEWTVKTHVASILRKLGLRDRAQVVVAAYESGLVRRGDV